MGDHSPWDSPGNLSPCPPVAMATWLYVSMSCGCSGSNCCGGKTKKRGSGSRGPELESEGRWSVALGKGLDTSLSASSHPTGMSPIMTRPLLYGSSSPLGLLSLPVSLSSRSRDHVPRCNCGCQSCGCVAGPMLGSAARGRIPGACGFPVVAGCNSTELPLVSSAGLFRIILGLGIRGLSGSDEREEWASKIALWVHLIRHLVTF